MPIFRKHYSILSNCLLIAIVFLGGCSPIHKQMKSAGVDINLLQKFKPVFNTSLYKTTVDVVGNHLSGLLLIKEMPDSTTRMVFSSESGISFFDFGFAANGNFKVFSIIKKMNKKSVIKTLRHDFELILMKKMSYSKASVKTQNGLLYFVFPQAKGYNYYVTDSLATRLIKMERASNNKIIVEAIVKNYLGDTPDTIGISHKTFQFNIGLKHIDR